MASRPNRAVTIYRRVHVPGKEKSTYCRAVVYASGEIHATKVEYQGQVLTAGEGDFYIAYRCPQLRWDRIGADPKLARRAAEAKRGELAAIAAGIIQPSARVGVQGVQVAIDVARDTYLNDLRRTRGEGTYDLFFQTLWEFTNWLGVQYPKLKTMTGIQREHLLSYYDVLVTRGLSLRRGETELIPASPSTGGKKCDRVNQWIRRTLGLRPGCGPIRRSDLPRECFSEEEVEVFSPQELSAFFAACGGEDYLLFSLFLHTGLRNKEMSFLTWDDVDLEGGFVTVRPKEGFKVKNGETRTVPITDDDLLARLEAHKKVSKFSYVFSTSTGGRVRDFLDRAKAVGERAGMKRGDVWVHKFRASCATGLAIDGLGFTAVQQLLGHRDSKVTKRYLAKATDLRLREAIMAVRTQAAGRKLALVKKATA
jgi:integrase